MPAWSTLMPSTRPRFGHWWVSVIFIYKISPHKGTFENSKFTSEFEMCLHCVYICMYLRWSHEYISMNTSQIRSELQDVAHICTYWCKPNNTAWRQ
jgi:hypothetical protein